MIRNHALETLRATQVLRARVAGGFRHPRAPISDHTAVFATGGIGDVIVSVRVAEELNSRLRDVVLYTEYPEVARYFSHRVPVRPAAPLLARGLDWFIQLNSSARFQFSDSFRGFYNLEAFECLLAHEAFCYSNDSKWKRFRDTHPECDNLMAAEAVKMGLDRQTLPMAYLGLSTQPQDFIRPARRVVGNYITVHDGFDGSHESGFRATKTWSLAAWKEFVQITKNNFPGLKIIQLGGPRSRHIFGVDEDLIGSCTMTESLDILAGSLAHVDGDSGLVHAAYALRVTSVVLFGPTDGQFFGYRGNVNIQPTGCSNCWWLTPTWMRHCPGGYETPECMDTHGPRAVFAELENLISVQVRIMRPLDGPEIMATGDFARLVDHSVTEPRKERRKYVPESPESPRRFGIAFGPHGSRHP